MPVPVKFQIISDLHLETQPSYDYDFPQTAPYLALLGDIGHIERTETFNFLRLQLSRFRLVFYLFGNHEPYHLSMQFAKKRITDFMTQMKKLRETIKIGEFVFLDKNGFNVNEEITVLGCTLFSKVLVEQAFDVQSRMVDFRDILHWDVGEHVDAHLEDLQWLNEKVVEVSKTGRKIIIFTHYSPSRDPRACNARNRSSEVWSGFSTDLSMEECWKNKAVLFWGFGHTHFNCDFIDDTGKRVVANQKGYHAVPQSTFRPDTVFQIGGFWEAQSDM